jgi:phage terminase small subunit
MAERPLTTKQRLFVEAYLANPNATEAARKAGYKGNDDTLKQVGSENLAKPYIRALVEKRVQEAIITADEVLTGIKTIAINGERDADRLKGYELLGKHLKLFTDRSEITLDVSNLTDEELEAVAKAKG